jgi:hypothetical protein
MTVVDTDAVAAVVSDAAASVAHAGAGRTVGDDPTAAGGDFSIIPLLLSAGQICREVVAPICG